MADKLKGHWCEHAPNPRSGQKARNKGGVLYVYLRRTEASLHGLSLEHVKSSGQVLGVCIIRLTGANRQKPCLI